MKTKALIVLTFVTLLLLTGCARKDGFSVSVEPLENTTKNGTVAGIPFYKKIPVFVQTSIYLHPFYEIKLYASEGKVGNEMKPTAIPSAKMLIYESDLLKFSNFLNKAEKLSSASAVISYFNNTISEKEQYQIKGFEDFIDVEIAKKNMPKLFSNNTEFKIVVDWLNQYYLNYKVPLAGSSSLTAELSAEGTLNKAIGETEDKTAEMALGAISSFFPIKEFFTKKWIGEESTEVATKKPKLQKIISVSLEVEKKVCRYTLTKIYRKLSEITGAIRLDNQLANMNLEIIDSATAKKDDKKDAAKNTIEISGQIKMPEKENSDKK